MNPSNVQKSQSSDSLSSYKISSSESTSSGFLRSSGAVVTLRKRKAQINRQAKVEPVDASQSLVIFRNRPSDREPIQINLQLPSPREAPYTSRDQHLSILKKKTPPVPVKKEGKKLFSPRSRKKTSLPENIQSRKRTSSSKTKRKQIKGLPKVPSLNNLKKGGSFSPRSSYVMKWEENAVPYFETKGSPGRKNASLFIDPYYEKKPIHAKDFLDKIIESGKTEPFSQALIDMTDVVAYGEQYRCLANAIFERCAESDAWTMTSCVLAGRAKKELLDRSDVPMRTGSFATFLFAEGCKQKTVVRFLDITSKHFFNIVRKDAKKDSKEQAVLNALDCFLRDLNKQADSFPATIRATLSDVYYTIKRIKNSKKASLLTINLLFLRVINPYLTRNISSSLSDQDEKKFLLLAVRTLQMAASENSASSDHAADLTKMKNFIETIHLEMVKTAGKLLRINFKTHGKKKSKSKKT